MAGRWGTRFAIAALALGIAGSQAVAQPAGFDAYEGTITVSGSKSHPEVHYQGRIKVVMPVSSEDARSITAEFLSGEAPNGILELDQWDESETGSTPDYDGKVTSHRCSLAGPVSVPVSVTGVLEIDLREKVHDFSVTVVSLRDIDFNCASSRSGPYKRSGGIALTTGTGVPGSQYETQLPFADSSRLTGQFTLDPTEYSQGAFGPIVQQWDFRRAH